MPLIIDTDVLHLVLPAPNGGDFEPVWKALENHQAIAVYGGKLADEYANSQRILRLIIELARQGAFKRVPDNAVNQQTRKLTQNAQLRSNDPHIIALAELSGARLLCSHDTDLHADFTNRDILSPRGHVYQSPKHQHLLRKYGN